MLRAGEALRHQILGNGDEVIPGTLLVLADRALVPVRPELAPAAHIAQHISAAIFQP